LGWKSWKTVLFSDREAEKIGIKFKTDLEKSFFVEYSSSKYDG